MKLRTRKAAAKQAEKIPVSTASRRKTSSSRKTTASKKLKTSEGNSEARKPESKSSAESTPLHQKFINEIADEARRSTVLHLHEMISRIAPELEPTLEFGKTLGYGKYHYKYKSGREGDWMRVGISVNKKNVSLSCCGCVDGRYVVEGFQNRLAKNKSKVHIGKGCIRFSSLEDLNMQAVEELIRATAGADIME